MPYNGSGGFSLAQSAFLPNTVISSSEMNSDLSDIASNGLTNAVTKDGQTTITAPFKGASGSVGAPMYSFSADLDGGMYRIGANNIGISVNATKIVDIATTGVGITGDLAVSGELTAASTSFVPPGVMFSYGGSSAPTGFLLCFGQSVLRSDYPALFTAIGITFGSVDGTHFTLPDGRGRTLAGRDDMGGSAANRLTTAGSGIDGVTLGAVGGAQNVALVTAELASHRHAVFLNDPGHAHITPGATAAGGGIAYTGGTNNTADTITNPASTGITVRDTTGGGGTANQTALNGSGTAHLNAQPTIIVNIIIKT